MTPQEAVEQIGALLRDVEPETPSPLPVEEVRVHVKVQASRARRFPPLTSAQQAVSRALRDFSHLRPESLTWRERLAASGYDVVRWWTEAYRG